LEEEAQLDRLEKNCVFVLRKEHRNEDKQKLLASYAHSSTLTRSKDFMDTLTAAGTP
jgi:hypothetical protein